MHHLDCVSLHILYIQFKHSKLCMVRILEVQIQSIASATRTICICLFICGAVQIQFIPSKLCMVKIYGRTIYIVTLSTVKI